MTEIDSAVGLVCPRCQCRELFVTGVRQIYGNRKRRRRECRHCGQIIYTLERVIDSRPPEPAPVCVAADGTPNAEAYPAAPNGNPPTAQQTKIGSPKRRPRKKSTSAHRASDAH